MIARRLLGALILFAAGFLAACGVPQQPLPMAAPSQNASTTPTLPTPSPTPTPQPTATPTVLPPTATSTVPVCSPLDGVPLDELGETVVNPYAPPPLGSDDPHQGVDLAQLLPGSRIAVAGLPVHAVLSGRVAGVVRDRFPYGNALLVETPLDSLPAAWQAGEVLPEPGATPQVRSSLTCPPADPQAVGGGPERSLYLLYAHMQEAPAFQPGDPLECGQVVGAIGSSGNALNPHLHLEARVGPSGAVFTGLAHSETRATPAEMGNYCLWRVSGAFLPLDPLRLLGSLAQLP